MILIRWVNHTCFQPRISLISGTLALALADLAHFALACAVATCMFGSLAVAVFGYRVKSASRLASAINAMVQCETSARMHSLELHPGGVCLTLLP